MVCEAMWSMCAVCGAMWCVCAVCGAMCAERYLMCSIEASNKIDKC